MAESGTPARRRPNPFVRLARSLVILILLAGFGLAAGFALFIADIPRDVRNDTASGDAIVVLTGGAERIGDAIGLLADARARRLLISGVNPETTKEEIARAHPGVGRWLECCVDLGHRALNTAGNAAETRQWVRRNGFKRVVVVTSAWHMRRSLLELQRALPETILVAYPVQGGSAANSDWWRDPRAIRLLVAEYVKYLAAVVEVRIRPRLASEPDATT
jgi:uncharacterized SAM-binding protein YcdF (DUF218 family)